MGDIVNPTAEELAQHEKDQQDPAWLEWLAGMDSALAVFFTDDVPGLPEDPYTEEGLRHAERAALEYFPTKFSPDRPKNQERADRFRRFIGETFVRNFEGRWRNFAAGRVSHPVAEIIAFTNIDPAEQLSSALWLDRDGESWAYVFGNARRHYADWVEHGRMPAAAWNEFRADRRLAQATGED